MKSKMARRAQFVLEHSVQGVVCQNLHTLLTHSILQEHIIYGADK